MAMAVISEMVEAPARLSITSAAVHDHGHIIDVLPHIHVGIVRQVNAPFLQRLQHSTVVALTHAVDVVEGLLPPGTPVPRSPPCAGS